MDAEGVVGHVLAYGVLEMDVQLVDAGRVVDIGHDLIRCNASLLENLVAALGVQLLQHRYMGAPEVPDGFQLGVGDNREPMEALGPPPDAPAVLWGAEVWLWGGQ